MNKEYLPCPFCGGEIVETKDVIMEIGANVYRVRCQNCQSCSLIFSTKEECIKSWNKCPACGEFTETSDAPDYSEETDCEHCGETISIID